MKDLFLTNDVNHMSVTARLQRAGYTNQEGLLTSIFFLRYTYLESLIFLHMLLYIIIVKYIYKYKKEAFGCHNVHLLY
jgi:hypothetical protein